MGYAGPWWARSPGTCLVATLTRLTMPGLFMRACMSVFLLESNRSCRDDRAMLLQLLGQELAPGPDPFGVSRRWEQSAISHGLASGYRHRYHPFALMGGRQVATEQVLPARYFRARHVVSPADGLAKRELDEAGRDLAGIDRLDTKAPRHRCHQRKLR